MDSNNIKDDLKLKLSDIPLESSLGLLALGDVAFEAWREVKKEHNIEMKNATKSKK